MSLLPYYLLYINNPLQTIHFHLFFLLYIASVNFTFVDTVLFPFLLGNLLLLLQGRVYFEGASSMKRDFDLKEKLGQIEKPCFSHGRTSERCYRNF